MDTRPFKPEMQGSSPAGATVAIGQWQLSERSSLCRYVALLMGAQDVRGTSVLRRPKRSVDRLPLVTLWMGMPSGEGSGL